LKPVRVKGRGWDELLGKRLVEAYLPYISRTQLSSVVAGIAPIRSLLNITSGVGDLIYTPMQQWQKDGRILTGKCAVGRARVRWRVKVCWHDITWRGSVRTGLQRGASTALHKWLVEGLNVGTNLTAGAQYVLEAADYYLGGSGTT
jgi:autophagy-related protein 2